MVAVRPLVFGAGGQVGTAFINLLDEAVPVTRDEIDLSVAQADDIRRALVDLKPSLVINCAAYTAVDRAESEEALATRINGSVVGWMAEAAAEIGVPFLTFSSDYVFDGTGDRPYLENHPTNPINAYGRTKLAGEQAALAAHGRSLVVRTSWVLSSTHRNFVTAILGRISRGEVLKVVNDQIGCPTVADDLAAACWEAMERGATGLLHLTNHGETTWYELARVAADAAGMDRTLVTPCTTAEYPTPARRPAYSVLGSEMSERLSLSPIPHWEDSMQGVVEGSLQLIGQS